MPRTRSAQPNESTLLASSRYSDERFLFRHPDQSVSDLGRSSHAFLCQQARHNQPSPKALPRLALHGLHNTLVTLALYDRVDIKLLSERLKHSRTLVTQKLYTPHAANAERCKQSTLLRADAPRNSLPQHRA